MNISSEQAQLMEPDWPAGRKSAQGSAMDCLPEDELCGERYPGLKNQKGGG